MDETTLRITDRTERELTRIAIRHQVEGRIPGLLAGVARAGTLSWTAGVGTADLASPGMAPMPTPSTRSLRTPRPSLRRW